MSLLKGTISKSISPTINEDSSKGFYIGFTWINTASDTIFTCSDDSVGAAIWKRTGGNESIITKIADYTVLSVDEIIRVDSSGGVFTITLEANPDEGREITIIDYNGNCGTNPVTINGDGNEIIGFDFALMNINYIVYNLTFNGTNWSL